MKGRRVSSGIWPVQGTWWVAFVLVLIAFPQCGFSEVLKLDYAGFSVWLDCDRRGAVQFHYTALADSGSHKRFSRFFFDPRVPKRCQQTSTGSYKHPKSEVRYDRGHLVPANHMDGTRKSIKQSNFMTNVLPQAANMNRGAWLRTEEIVECHRDILPLEVWGGVIWGDSPDDDYFTESHGIKTPEAFWKVVLKGGTGIAWVIPNSSEAKRSMLDSYLVSIRTIEGISSLRFDIQTEQKIEPQSESWAIPKGCNRG